MAFELSRVDRLTRTYDLSTIPLGGDGAATPSSVEVALLPVRSGGPTLETEWTTAAYASGTVTILLAGPDADPTGALVVPATAMLWMKVIDAPEVDAVKVERITVLGGGSLLPAAAPFVSTVNGESGTVVLTAADLGAQAAGDYATNTALTNGLALKANTASLATVATTGAYNDLSGKPTLGTAAAQDTTAFDAAGAAAAAQAAAIQRANHTGTQSADTLTDGTTNKAFLATERTKLTGIATGATANATDAQLRDRSTHTGTQSLDTTTDSATRLAMTSAERAMLTNATVNVVASTLVLRTGGGSGSFANIDVSNAPSAVQHAARKDYVDSGDAALTSIAAIPPRVGKLAVVAGVGYIATGTASTADWKQIT